MHTYPLIISSCVQSLSSLPLRTMYLLTMQCLVCTNHNTFCACINLSVFALLLVQVYLYPILPSLSILYSLSVLQIITCTVYVRMVSIAVFDHLSCVDVSARARNKFQIASECMMYFVSPQCVGASVSVCHFLCVTLCISYLISTKWCTEPCACHNAMQL